MTIYLLYSGSYWDDGLLVGAYRYKGTAISRIKEDVGFVRNNRDKKLFENGEKGWWYRINQETLNTDKATKETK